MKPLFQMDILALTLVRFILLLIMPLMGGISPLPALAQDLVFMNVPPSVDDASRLVNAASPGIVLIITYDNTGEESGRGNGFLLDSEGRILTNASVLKGAFSAEVRSLSHMYRDVVILKQDEVRDLALMKITADNEQPLRLDTAVKLSPGLRIVAAGKNILMEETASEGYIEAIRNETDKTELIEIRKADSPLVLGSALNGPLLDLSGNVIGLITSEFNIHPVFGKMPVQSEDRTFHAISIRTIQQFLAGPDMPARLHPAKSRDWFAWFSSRLKNAVTISFVTLYDIGFMKLIAILIGILLFLAFVEWMITRMINVLKRNKQAGRN